MNTAGIVLLLTGALWAQVPGLRQKLMGRVIITGITFASKTSGRPISIRESCFACRRREQLLWWRTHTAGRLSMA
jgi:hypothetical protein